MDKTEFLTIFPTFEKLDVVRETLPSVIEETRRMDARLIVHDCSSRNREEKWAYLRELNRNGDFFLLLSDNMSLAHSRNMCLALGQEMYAPDYICLLEDDHGLRPGVISKLVNAMQRYYGKEAPNGLRFGMFSACTVHTHAKFQALEGGDLCPTADSDPFSVGGANNCFRCAPTSHWNNVLKHYETDEYLLSEFQTAAPRWRNYHKGFTVLFVDGGKGTYEVENVGRGMTGNTAARLWDNRYCASDRRSRYIGKSGVPKNEIRGTEGASGSSASPSEGPEKYLEANERGTVGRILSRILRRAGIQ